MELFSKIIKRREGTDLMYDLWFKNVMQWYLVKQRVERSKCHKIKELVDKAT